MKDKAVEGQSRIVLIDAIRGFALLGILLTHFNHWYVVGPLPDFVTHKNYGSFSKVTEWIVSCFISNKFYILFSFVFGLSFQLQSKSFQKYATNINLVFYRRAFFLFIIGAIHYILWLGDILVVYAILMIPLIWFKRISDTILWIIALLLVTNIPGMVLNLYHLSHMKSNVTTPALAAENPIAINLYNAVSNGNWKEIIRFNISFIRSRIQFQIWGGSIFMIFGYFILGMLTAKNGWLLKINSFKKYLLYVIILGVIFLIMLHYVSSKCSEPITDTQSKIASMFIAVMQSIVSVTTNIAIVAFLFTKNALSKIGNWLAIIGKMALTNYITQTAIGLCLFYHIGFGLFAKTTPALNFFLAIAIFILQIFCSSLWLKKFNYGIIEWLLRSGTLWQFKNLRKKTS